MSRELRGTGNVYKRGETWWVRFNYRGREYRESSHSRERKQAVKLLKKRLGEMGAGKQIVGPAEDRVTFDEMESIVVADYVANGRKSIGLVKLAFHRLRPQFGVVRAVDITADKITAWSADRVKEGLSHSSVNYTLAVLRRAFRLLQRAGKIATIPYVALLEPDAARQGFLEPADFANLCANLPEYLRDPVRFLYFSGWRVGEMRTLEWRDVDLAVRAIRLRPENSKNKRSRILKLGGELLAILQRAEQNRDPQCSRVFHYHGAPIGNFKKSWHSAAVVTGLGRWLNEYGEPAEKAKDRDHYEGVRIHDLRRSAIRNMVRAGIHERVAMEISGHKTRTVFERYNIVSESDLDTAVERIDRYVAMREQEKPKVVPLPQKAA